MGGCCCCSSRGTERSSSTTYYFYPTASEEHVPLSTHRGPASALSTGLLVDTNLDTSTPDTYRPPPAPIPYDMAVRNPRSPPLSQEICGNKGDVAAQGRNSDSVLETAGVDIRNPSTKIEELDDYKVQADSEPDKAKQSEVELAKSVEPVDIVSVEEDACPICLEEYDAENPKVTTKCVHDFHLACILEWMERSETCPVCDQEMIFDPPID